MSFVLSTALATYLCLAGAPLTPPSAEEQRLFAEGLRAYQAGDARAAERAWKAGYAVKRDPAFLVRVGEAQEKAGAPAEAVESYRRYLREAPDAADKAEIEQRVTRLAPALPPAPPPPAADGNEIPGELGAGATAPPPSPAAPRPAPVAAFPASDSERPASPEEETGWNASKVTAWVATALAVTMLGTAGFLAASASSKQDDINVLFRVDEVTGAPVEYGDVAARYESLMNDGRRYDRYAKFALVGAGMAAAVAATFFVIDAARTREVGVALVPTGGSGAGAGALGSMSWTF